MRAIIVGALILASGAFVSGCRRDQGAQQQGTQQSGQPPAQPGAQPGTGGGGLSGTSQDRVIPQGGVGSPRTDGATGTSPDTGPVQRGPAGSQSGGAVVPSPTPPPDKETRGPRGQPGASVAASTLRIATVSFMSPQEEEADTRDGTENQPPQHGGSGLVTEEGAAGDAFEQQEQGTADDTLPHTMPEMQEGLGGSGPVDPGDPDEALPDEPQFPEEEPLFIPPLEALKPFSEGQQGTGGSGLDDGSGAEEEEPLVEPLGNDEFQGH